MAVSDQGTDILSGCAAPAWREICTFEHRVLLRARHVHDHDIFSIRLALEEALVNAIKHGNQMDPSKKVQVSYQIHSDGFEVHIADEGAGTPPTKVFIGTIKTTGICSIERAVKYGCHRS